MYLPFFSLDEAPFNLTPDTAFFYSNPSHQEALNTLLVALQMGEGFIKVTGEVGTGKTLLCRKLLRELEAIPSFVTAYIANPALSPTALHYSLADELGIHYDRDLAQHEVMQLISNRLLEERKRENRVVLVIDEAQALPHECLEAVRLLTNLETEKSKLLQVVLLGQPELDVHLAEPSVRQLRQRVTFSQTLMPMNSEAVGGYLAHRMGIAGYRGPCMFSWEVARDIAQASEGIPRLINIIAHKCLLAAYGEGRMIVTRRHVRLASRDTEAVNAGRPRSGRRRAAVVVAGALSAGAAAFGTLLLQGMG